MNRLRYFAPERLEELLEKFPRARVAVVGDFFLDKYFEVDPGLEERSLETGKPAHQVVRVRHSPGAAGTVVCNLVALDAGQVIPVGFVGDDGEGYELRQDLERLGCPLEYLPVTEELRTPTYLKPRDITDPTLAGEHSRYDLKNRRGIPAELEAKIISFVDKLVASGINAVIVADQVEESFHGVITPRLREVLSDLARKYPATVFWADSRRYIRQFRHVIIKPNYREAFGLDQPPDFSAGMAREWAEKVDQMRQQAGAPVVVTCGEKGMLVTDPERTWIPAVRLSGPVDPTGAGDSATAGAVLALASGASLPEAALVGTLVASITVEQLGTTGTASRRELLPRLEVWRSQQQMD
ncbi:MAG: PfkB family carbohydrate kinase [Thermoguttaceae bacterium]|nr:PfkB family carbohydrate kinase [Thermoguttaceae bacterium]MDW8080025.1 PfkB family carbohydrate kinase [Thermoguttaceae bacterium]